MRVVTACLVALVLASCAAGGAGGISTTAVPAPHAVDDGCPRVVAVELTQVEPGRFDVSTTVRSVDVAGASFADAWEVRDLEGGVLGERILTHAHTNEQPFIRLLSGVAIATDIAQVEVAVRDSVRGFCGPPLIVEVPHS